MEIAVRRRLFIQTPYGHEGQRSLGTSGGKISDGNGNAHRSVPNSVRRYSVDENGIVVIDKEAMHFIINVVNNNISNAYVAMYDSFLLKDLDGWKGK